MREKYTVWLRFEWILIILIVASFFLPWISWSKMVYTGFDLPFIYKKTTKISNTVLFFLKKESLYLAFYIYLVPILSILAALFVCKRKVRSANAFLFLSSLLGFVLSLYMYYYFISSKLFKLSHAGVGIHLLCIVSFIGIIYSSVLTFKKKRNREKEIIEEVVTLDV